MGPEGVQNELARQWKDPDEALKLIDFDLTDGDSLREADEDASKVLDRHQKQRHCMLDQTTCIWFCNDAYIRNKSERRLPA